MKEEIGKHVSYRVRLRQRRRWLALFVIFNIILSVSILSLPFVLTSDEAVIPYRFLVGALFWIGLIGLIVTAIWINTKRKRSNGFKIANNGRRKIGLIHFFQNNYATVVDVLMFISLLAVILLEWAAHKQSLAISTIGVFIFSFNMHCMLNGICYEYINYKVRRVNNHGNSEESVG